MNHIKKLALPFSLISALLSFLFLCHLIYIHPLSSDSYLHLAIGRYIALFQQIPSHYDISYKTADYTIEWFSHSWLSDILLYSFTQFNISVGSIVLNIFLWLVTVSIFWLICEELKLANISRFLTLTLIQFILPVYWRLHPLLFIVPLTLFASLILIKTSRNRHSNRLLFLPVVSLVWANLYGGYIFIYFLILLSFLVYHIVLKMMKKPSYIFQLFAITLVSFATSLINPYGWRIFVYLITFIGTIQLKQAFVALPNFLTLINQSFVHENVSTIPYSLFTVIMIICLAAPLLMLIRKKSKFFSLYSPTIPLVSAFILAYGFIRFIPLTLCIISPLAASLFDYLYKSWKWTPFLYILLTALSIPYLAYQIIFPYKVLSITQPQSQVRLLEKIKLPANYMTTAEYTGYLKYSLPTSKMNLDAWDEIFDESETLNLLLAGGIFTKERLLSTLNTKHINTIIISKETGNLARSIQLQLKDEWALIYLDSNSAMFVRRNKVSKAFLEKNELKYLTLANDLGVDPNRIPEATIELEQAVKYFPENTLYRGELATLYRIQNKPDKAEAVLLAIPINQWNYILDTEMGRLQASKGNCIEAEQYFLRALDDRSEQNYSQAVLDLAVVYGGCLQDKNKAKHYFDRYLSFTLPQSEKEKARKLASEFGIKVD